MSTTTYLSKLNLEQLESARDEVARLIEDKKAKPLKTVWCVEDALCNLKSFGDYLQAAGFLFECAKSNTETGMPLRNRDMELSLVSRKVPEDEYSQWIDSFQ